MLSHARAGIPAQTGYKDTLCESQQLSEERPQLATVASGSLCKELRHLIL